jgi:hypothetical protein
MCESKPNRLSSSSKRVVRNTYKGLYRTDTIPHLVARNACRLLPSELPFLFFLLLFIETEKRKWESEYAFA